MPPRSRIFISETDAAKGKNSKEKGVKSPKNKSKKTGVVAVRAKVPLQRRKRHLGNPKVKTSRNPFLPVRGAARRLAKGPKRQMPVLD